MNGDRETFSLPFQLTADREQDWQPYPVDQYSAICDDHTVYIHTYSAISDGPYVKVADFSIYFIYSIYLCMYLCMYLFYFFWREKGSASEKKERIEPQSPTTSSELSTARTPATVNLLQYIV